MKKEEAKLDLLYMLDELDKNHISLYYSTSRKEILDYIDKLLNTIKYDNYFDFLYLVKLVIKRLSGKYDQHMHASYKDLHVLPLRFTYLNRSLYLIDGLPEHKEHLYKKIIKINDIETNTILREYFATINNDIPTYKNYLLRKLLFEDFLQLPSIDSNCHVLEFQFEDNSIVKVDININYHPTPPKIDVIEKQLSNFIYLKFPSFNLSTASLEKLVNKLRVAKDRQKMDYLVIDLRDIVINSNNTKPLSILAKAIKQYKFKTYVAVNGGTYGVGAIAAYELKLAGAILVGEDIGSTLTGFTKGYGFIELPNSGITLMNSCAFQYPTSRGISLIENKKDFKKLNSSYKKILYFDVDKEIRNKLIDYKENKDIVMKYIINTEEKNK
jgi:hypothetical protein